MNLSYHAYLFAGKAPAPSDKSLTLKPWGKDLGKIRLHDSTFLHATVTCTINGNRSDGVPVVNWYK
jgi:hypothetical protein